MGNLPKSRRMRGGAGIEAWAADFQAECLAPHQAALEAKPGPSKWVRIVTDSSNKNKGTG